MSAELQLYIELFTIALYAASAFAIAMMVCIVFVTIHVAMRVRRLRKQGRTVVVGFPGIVLDVTIPQPPQPPQWTWGEPRDE